jgi:hypothetical protein
LRVLRSSSRTGSGSALLAEALTEAEPEHAVTCKVGFGRPAASLVAMAAAEQAHPAPEGAVCARAVRANQRFRGRRGRGGSRSG